MNQIVNPLTAPVKVYYSQLSLQMHDNLSVVQVDILSLPTTITVSLTSLSDEHDLGVHPSNPPHHKPRSGMVEAWSKKQSPPV
jgi:hypothetical protein